MVLIGFKMAKMSGKSQQKSMACLQSGLTALKSRRNMKRSMNLKERSSNFKSLQQSVSTMLKVS